VGLLKPAYQSANGHRFYEGPQLLTLQQILFYRELGFELKQIREILKRPDFEKVNALMAHRKVLDETLARTPTLLQTIDKTAEHLKGGIPMENEELFAGFAVAAGRDRFDEHVSLGEEPIHCKLSGRDTDGYAQDQWVYVVTGSLDFEVGDRKFRASAGGVASINWLMLSYYQDPKTVV
jgi:DNA-binding transcriptional MerR regulator